ncbi:uncharacterized protein EV154DRAFT_504087 [Mucor mucedo]|uniref:uncharacterized protein n=1 Tax=Mucor mucedo TaxID=29922 RepID=UPI002220AC5A|nr:uncharacterized protein EV154DRAFT_504087 [Mucor mucedo]KAI7892778.1 hypothetical protein EV154DRAFT_504087 [Mucor mucedo]
MDLSWCIMCDRHCIDNNLYCSESCRFQDNTGHHHDSKPKSIQPELNMFKSPSLVSPPSSPILAPFLYSFQPSYDRRRSTSAASMQHATTSTCTNYQYFPYQCTPSSPSASSLFDDDT